MQRINTATNTHTARKIDRKNPSIRLNPIMVHSGRWQLGSVVLPKHLADGWLILTRP